MLLNEDSFSLFETERNSELRTRTVHRNSKIESQSLWEIRENLHHFIRFIARFIPILYGFTLVCGLQARVYTPLLQAKRSSGKKEARETLAAIYMVLCCFIYPNLTAASG
jgi:hypothetical protein